MQKKFLALAVLLVVMMFAAASALGADGSAPQADTVWYSSNTIGVAGLSLRDHLGLSNQWYNVVPVDLTVEGTQTIPLIASNIYLFGEAEVTVADGSVTVVCHLPDGNVRLESECLHWFTSLDEITADFLSNPVGAQAFGEPVSIADSLKGQDVALLFICNRATYSQPLSPSGAELERYHVNFNDWVIRRAHLVHLLARIDGDVSVRIIAK